MVDKNFCMSSYLALRYIEKDEVDFYPDLHHKNITPLKDSDRVYVGNADDIDKELRKQILLFESRKKGILLSGGMDSAIVASYLSGSDAYTFRFLGGKYKKDELERAEYYAKKYSLTLHYVDITWETVQKYLEVVMRGKCAPVHSIEPQILQAALQAKDDGIEIMFIGESSDLVFGGMDGLLSKDWKFDDFKERYIFTKPEEVLIEPVSIDYVFERYKQGDYIDYLSFMDDVFAIESSSSYQNAFAVADVSYYDPYAKLKMKDRLDLNRIRRGDSKYLIRELMARKYPDVEVPNKIPMPRPVDEYFKNWEGPKRKEFRNDIEISKYDGNQKWQLYCLESFLNMFE